MIDRVLQESLVKQITENMLQFDIDLLKELYDKISHVFSETSEKDQFIKLYNETREKINKIRTDKEWEEMWTYLFEKNGIISRAYKLVPFNTDIVDSSYEDEVMWIMYNWEEAVLSLKEKYITLP